MAKFTHEDAQDDSPWPLDKRIDGTDSADEIDTTQGNSYYNIYAGAGDDIVNDGEGKSNIHGGDGDDILNGGGASLDSFFLWNTIYGDSGNDTITVSSGDSRLYGGDGDDKITGAAGKDRIVGGIGNDIIEGKAGDDSLWGGEGDDVITTGLGSDSTNGGAGNDTAVLNISTSDVSLYDNYNGVITITSSEGTDTFQEVEFFQFADAIIALADMDSEFSDVQFRGEEIYLGDYDTEGSGTNLDDKFYINSWYNTTIYGKDGNDIVYVNRHTGSTIYGGEGSDTVVLKNTSKSELGAFIVNGDKMTLLTWGGGNYTLSSIETIHFADANYSLDTFKNEFSELELDSTVILGDKSNSSLYGTSQDDLLYTGSRWGSYSVDGGGGIDTIVFEFSSSDVSRYSNNNGEIYFGRGDGWSGFNVTNIEKFKFQGRTIALQDLDTEFFAVNTSDQTINGTSGNDQLSGGLGNDTFNGLAGIDTAIIDDNSVNIQEYTNDGTTVTFFGKLGNDSYVNFEYFQFQDALLSIDELNSAFYLVNTADWQAPSILDT